MKKHIKNILIMMMIVLLTFSLITAVDASGMSEIIKDNFQGNANATGSQPIVQILSSVLEVVRTAGAGIAVIILMVIAAKYIMASAGDRADIKKYAINYIIGAIILFGTSGILTIVKNFIDASLKD